MAEGILFYWISWILWIVVTFLMKKNITRTLLAGWILLAVSFSNVYFTVYSIDVSLLLLFFIIGSLFMYVYFQEKVYNLYRPFMIMIGYTSFLLLEKGMPIWIFLPKGIIIPIICSLMIIILTKELYSQIISGILGIAAGELLFSLILHSYDLPKQIGDEFLFDTILATIFLIVCVNMLQKVRAKAFAFVL